MEAVEKALHDFFSYLSVLSPEWASKCKGSEATLVALKNQSEQLQLVNKANWSQNLLNSFPDIKEKLLCKIVTGLEDETLLLNDVCKTLCDSKKKLDSKLHLIEKCAHKLDISCDSSYGAMSPPIYKLIEYAEDVAHYYSVLYIQMTHALGSLNYEDEQSVQHVQEVFHKSADAHGTINGYIAMWKTLQNC